MVREIQIFDFFILLFPIVQLLVKGDDFRSEIFELFQISKAIDLQFEEVEKGVHELGLHCEGDHFRFDFEFHFFLFEVDVLLKFCFGLSLLLHDK